MDSKQVFYPGIYAATVEGRPCTARVFHTFYIILDSHIGHICVFDTDRTELVAEIVEETYVNGDLRRKTVARYRSGYACDSLHHVLTQAIKNNTVYYGVPTVDARLLIKRVL